MLALPPDRLAHRPTIKSLWPCVLLPACLQLASIGCPNEEANRRELREMLFTSPGIENYISGVVGAARCR